MEEKIESEKYLKPFVKNHVLKSGYTNTIYKCDYKNNSCA